MKLSFTLDGHESQAELERVTAAMLVFCGQSGVQFDGTVITDAQAAADLAGTPRPVADTPDPATLGFGITIGASHEADVATAETSLGVAAAPAGVQVDKHGLPWDARIHSSTKAINKTGEWKTRRNVDPAEVTRVEAELRAIMGAPAPAVAVPPPPPPAATTPVAAVPPPPVATPAPAPAVAPPAPAASGAPRVVGFGTLVAWIAYQTKAGKLQPDDIAAVMQGLGIVDGNGVGSVSKLVLRPDLVMPTYEQLSGIVTANGG